MMASIAVLGVWVILTATLVPAHARRTGRIPETAPAPVLPGLPMLLMQPTTPASHHSPFISVVLAARNESRHIARTIESLLAQTYAEFEIIAVDDRSEDDTGAQLDDLCVQHARLTVIHIDQLPPGWVGKNHALQCGSERARGDWILFTDADVYFYPTALSRFSDYVTGHRVDHLVVAPHILTATFWLRGLVAFFLFNFVVAFRPHRASNSKSRAHIGVGACNAVRADVYRSIGGHQPIAMRTDDDLRLGRLIKQHGFLQDMAVARDFAEVEWYASVRQFAVGFEKNALAPFHYSRFLLGLAILGMVVLYLGPWFLLAFGDGPSRILALVALVLEAWCYACCMRYAYESPITFVIVPISVVVFAVVLTRSAVLATLQGGVRWRGTFYSMEQLRRQTD